jgi:hypothetical protein
MVSGKPEILGSPGKLGCSDLESCDPLIILAGYRLFYAAFIAQIGLIVVGMLYKETNMSLQDFLTAMEGGARNALVSWSGRCNRRLYCRHHGVDRIGLKILANHD